MALYRDIYNWLEREKGLESRKILSLKTAAYKKNCSDIQICLDEGICSKEDLQQAIKDVYRLDTYVGDMTKLKTLNSISISDMDAERFIVTTPSENGKNLVLITDPKSKLSILQKIGKDASEVIIQFIFDEGFELWKKANSTTITDNKMNSTISNIEVASVVMEDKYDADDEQINEASIVGIVNKLISEAVDEKASDIHIEPTETSIIVRYRVDGLLKIHTTINDKKIHNQLVNRIKVLGKMDTNNQRTPQSGKINMRIREQDVDMRISTLPTIHGEKITIRILISSNSKIRTLEELGMDASVAEKVRFMADHPHGIILVSGPTGSGKSSTLASVLTEISNIEQCIVTIEDPVEYKIKGAVQVDVSKDKDLTFANVLREVLRQDPDIIMIGEIRDAETANIAITASNTGHLVFSTIHTNNAVSSITRLEDIGVESFAIADSLIGVISQRLVKVLCDDCKKEHIITEADKIKYKLPKRLIGRKVYQPCGCYKCNKGYNGRTIVPEIMEVDANIIEAINDKKSSQEIEKIAVKQGMKRQLEKAYDVMLDGKTSLQEVYRIFGGVTDAEDNN